MSFQEQNKYFLQRNFDRSFHELLEFEQVHQYNEKIRIDLIRRLKDHYQRLPNDDIGSKVDFYEEIILLFWKFEKEYILANILFEDDFNSIFTQLDKNRKVFNQAHLDHENRWSLGALFKVFKDKHVHYFSTNLSDFLKEYLHEITEDLDPHHWENSTNNPDSISVKITHSYPKYLVKELCHADHLERSLFTHILFTKAWILNFTHENINDARIAIIFMNELINEYRSNVTNDSIPQLHRFLTELATRFNRFFLEEFKKTPLLERPEEGHHPTGYYNQKKRLRDIVEQSEFLNRQDLESRSYKELFNVLCNAQSKAVMTRLEEVILNKINSLQYPSEEDLEGIQLLVESENNVFKRLRNEFLRRFYLFEYLI